MACSKLLRLLVAFALPLVLLPVLVACGGSSRAAPAPYDPPVLDMVALANREDRVLIFRDIGHRAFGDVAEVVLDQASSGIDRPTGVFVADDRLFVTSVDNGRVQIWNGFAALVGGAAPDVVLSGMYRPYRLFVDGTSLYVAGEDYVYIFRDIPTLVSGDGADVAISSGIDSAKDLLVAGGALYVANYQGHRVTVYNDAENIVANQPPDVTLDQTGSLIAEPIRLTWHAGTLYVANRQQAVYIFRNAAALMDGDAPDAVLGGPSDLDGVRRPLVDDSRIYVPNRYAYYEDLEPGFSIFDGPATVTSGQVADVTIWDRAVERCSASDLMGDVLVGFSQEDETFFVYLQAHAIEDDQPPDFELWDPRIINNDVGELILVSN